MTDEIALRVTVTGRVQGVWYRGWTRATAQGLGLRGWVRNEPDGSVAALIAGPEASVRRMVAMLREGPESARVVSVETVPADMPVDAGFLVRR